MLVELLKNHFKILTLVSWLLTKKINKTHYNANYNVHFNLDISICSISRISIRTCLLKGI